VEIGGQFQALRGGELQINTAVRLWVNLTATALCVERINDGNYWIMPPNVQVAPYTVIMQDAGGIVIHPATDGTARTFTIQNWATATWQQGTAITFANDVGGGVVTIAVTAPDNLILCPAGTTGSRTLTAPGMATMVAVAAGGGGAMRWLIQGTNLT
jgi:hypothetical protein